MNLINPFLNKITESKFFTFSERPLDFFDKDKLFKIIYMIICIAMAAITLVYPIRILFKMIGEGFFSFGARFGIKYVAAFFFIWLSIAAASWLGFHMWWNRRKKAATLFGQSEFVVLPFFSEIIRTIGEWLAIMLAIIGFVGGLFLLILLRGNDSVLPLILGIEDGLLSEIPFIGELFEMAFEFPLVFGPVVGIIIILITRFIAENLRVFASIANNTKKSSVFAAIANNAQKATANRNIVSEHTGIPRHTENSSQTEQI